MSEVSQTREFEISHPRQSPLALGHDIGGHPVRPIGQDATFLVACTTGSGKSPRGGNAMLLSIAVQSPPEEWRLDQIDPEMLELSI